MSVTWQFVGRGGRREAIVRGRRPVRLRFEDVQSLAPEAMQEGRVVFWTQCSDGIPDTERDPDVVVEATQFLDLYRQFGRLRGDRLVRVQ